MEEKEGCRNLVSSPPPSTPLLFFHSRGYEKMSLWSIGDEKHQLVKTTPPELHGKEILAYSHGWFILLHKVIRTLMFSLWNPLTLESICLPGLPLKSTQEISFCILSSPPGDFDSMLILFETKAPSFIWCSIGIGIGYKRWKRQDIKAKSWKMKNYYCLFAPVICNGTLYCCLQSHHRGSFRLVKIKLSMPNYRLPLILFDEFIPVPEGYFKATIACAYMLESCGELFVVYLIKGRLCAQVVISVEVFKLDFLAMVWNKVESIKNRAFFVSKISSFSCPATSEVKGNHVYFTLYGDKSLYSFNMDDKTVSVSLACPNLPISGSSTIWIKMPSDLRLGNMLIRQTKGDSHVRRKQIKPPEQAEGDFERLPLDMLLSIGMCLMPHDYMNLRSVNTRFRLATPPTPRRRADLKGDNSLPPLLMFCRKGDSICRFIDLCGEKYHMDIPNSQLKDVTRCDSREGWCLMLKGEHSMFLWNPFQERVIWLPNLPHGGLPFFRVSFSSSSNWVVLIGLTYDRCAFYIDHIFWAEGQWHNLSTKNTELQLHGCNNFAFYHEAFYTFCENGKLLSFRKGGELKFFERANQPCSSPQSYLVECDGKLMSVFVGFLGSWVRIFRLNGKTESTMVWTEVENLGNHTIYVSQYSSFAIPATHGMGNRVYFPRFYGKNAVYYSLVSKKLHPHGTEEVLNSFYNTKEQLCSNWIQSKRN
ncbi:hypothetical protein SLA2020_169320 [Shorea laevis]